MLTSERIRHSVNEDFSVEQDFFEMVSVGRGCWDWHGPVDRKHGTFQQTKAHRWSYEKFNGPLLRGYHIHHVCQNPLCVNPRHLEQLTPKEHSSQHSKQSTGVCD